MSLTIVIIFSLSYRSFLLRTFVYHCTVSLSAEKGPFKLNVLLILFTVETLRQFQCHKRGRWEGVAVPTSATGVEIYHRAVLSTDELLNSESPWPLKTPTAAASTHNTSHMLHRKDSQAWLHVVSTRQVTQEETGISIQTVSLSTPLTSSSFG